MTHPSEAPRAAARSSASDDAMDRLVGRRVECPFRVCPRTYGEERSTDPVCGHLSPGGGESETDAPHTGLARRHEAEVNCHVIVMREDEVWGACDRDPGGIEKLRGSHRVLGRDAELHVCHLGENWRIVPCFARGRSPFEVVRLTASEVVAQELHTPYL